MNSVIMMVSVLCCAHLTHAMDNFPRSQSMNGFQKVKRDGFDDTALTRAVSSGDLQKIQQVLFEEPELIDARGHRNQSPVHMAIEMRNHAILAALIKKGANRAQRGTFKRLPLHTAAWYGNDEAVKMLFACMTHQEIREQLKTKDQYGKTPQAIARARGHMKLADLFKDTCNDETNTDSE